MPTDKLEDFTEQEFLEFVRRVFMVRRNILGPSLRGDDGGLFEASAEELV